MACKSYRRWIPWFILAAALTKELVCSSTLSLEVFKLSDVKKAMVGRDPI